MESKITSKITRRGENDISCKIKLAASQMAPVNVRTSSRTSTKVSPSRNVSGRGNNNNKLGCMRVATIVACSLCLAACLMPIRQAECGRLQEFIQNLVGGGSSSSSSSSSSSGSNNSNKDNSGSSSSSNTNANNNDSSDSDTAASSDSNEQPLTPMMSAMNPFMRYPSFYDSFGPASFGTGGFGPGMSAFSGPMAGAMSALSPMAAMSSQSLAGAFSPTAFSPASFGSFGGSSGSFGSSASSPLSAYGSAASGAHLGGGGMSASSLNNIYASSPSNFLSGAYTPYYGRRR